MRPISVLAASLMLPVLTSLVMAQGTGTNPKPGTGSGTSPVTTGVGSDLDLPILPPTFGDSRTPPRTPDDDPGDDPNDTPPPTIYGEELETENDTIFYVLDISCSMGWGDTSYTTPDGRRRVGPRIERAKNELVKSIQGLSPNMLFNIIAYDCGIRPWKSDMQPADDEHKTEALVWIYRLHVAGATGTGPATAAALADKENMMVVLLTDGAPNCGADGFEGHRRMISSANTQGAVINVFGIAASGSWRAFCQGVASDSGGQYFDVP